MKLCDELTNLFKPVDESMQALQDYAREMRPLEESFDEKAKATFLNDVAKHIETITTILDLTMEKIKGLR